MTKSLVEEASSCAYASQKNANYILRIVRLSGRVHTKENARIVKMFFKVIREEHEGAAMDEMIDDAEWDLRKSGVRR